MGVSGSRGKITCRVAQQAGATSGSNDGVVVTTMVVNVSEPPDAR
jgi:hypothetical protein